MVSQDGSISRPLDLEYRTSAPFLCSQELKEAKVILRCETLRYCEGGMGGIYMVGKRETLCAWQVTLGWDLKDTRDGGYNVASWTSWNRKNSGGLSGSFFVEPASLAKSDVPPRTSFVLPFYI